MTTSKSQIYKIPQHIAPEIFRAYDIRGTVNNQLTPNIVYAIGLAVGTKARAQNYKKLVVGRDGRLSSPVLVQALIKGLLESGTDVIDIGVVSTPVLYYATYHLETQAGVMLTGSHNPKNDNGLKILLEGHILTESEIKSLYYKIIDTEFTYGQGDLNHYDVIQYYIERICKDIKLEKPLKIVVDAGNGATSEIAPRLFKALGCEVVELFCEIDGNFPHHHPDPSVEKNLLDLQKTVIAHEADLGLAFDGDGDRLGVVTNQGRIIDPDRLLMLFARELLKVKPGAYILFDVKCTRYLTEIIAQAGGQPLMWKTGHSLIKSKMKEIGAELAGEVSGHIFFKHRWYGFDDGLYAGARLLEILSQSSMNSEMIFKQFPNSVHTPEIKIPLAENRKHTFMDALLKTADFKGAKIDTTDGIRADFEVGWGLVRLSNTTPCLTLRFEADNEENLQHIQALFRTQLLKIDPHLQIPF